MKKRFGAAALLAAATLLSTHAVRAANVMPFVITGYIESFKLDNPNDPLSGAKMRVNGTDVVVPRNLIVKMPTIFLTPFDIFCLNPNAPGGPQPGALCTQAPPESGLALNDGMPPLAPYEATIQGNIIGDAHIAGLVDISQEFANAGAGYIKSIDLMTGEMIVGHDPAAPIAGTDARIKVDDPAGVHGRKMTNPELDHRFTIDPDSPSVRATTGYPMCVPRGPGDTLCPDTNRPAGMTKFIMGLNAFLPPTPGASLLLPCSSCDPTKQAPFEIGDYITYSGTLTRDAKGLFIAAHTVVASLGIYTAPNSNPAYVSIDVGLIGTIGPNMPGVPLEQKDRVRIEGFTTDPTRPVELYAVDVDPTSGTETVRRLGSIGSRLARYGEYRLIIQKGAGALVNFAGDIKGATREIMAVVSGGSYGKTPSPAYYAPVGEYLFPENSVPGDPLAPLNFECLAFLQQGSGPLTTSDRTTGPVVGRLSPWPGVASDSSSVFCGP